MFPRFGNFLWDSSNRITPRRSGQNAQRVIECKYAAAAKGEIKTKGALCDLVDRGIFPRSASFERITAGAGGAALYAAGGVGVDCVVKISSQSREYDFYRLNQALKLPFAPPVLYMEKSPEYGCVLVMEKFKAIDHSGWNPALQREAVDLCARLNSLDGALFPGLKRDFLAIDPRAAESARRSWMEVISRHGGRFDEAVLTAIQARLDQAAALLNTGPLSPCHGDFHPDNLVTDGKRLYLLDWENLHMGKGAGEISFFISRGRDFGIAMDEGALFAHYARRLSVYTGKAVSVEQLMKEHSASSLLTAFLYWAEYLKDAPYERVEGIFCQMAQAARALC